MTKRLAAALVLAVLVVVALLPVLDNGFVFDDHLYLLENDQVRSGLTAEGVRWALTSLDAANWHPLTWISHMLDVSLFGLDPRGHHAVSLLLHAANAVVLMLVLAWLTGSWVSALAVGLLFGLHPLHVESIAWVAERKDLLSTLSVLLALAAYRWHLARPSPDRFLAVLLLYGAALSSKPMVVTFPLLLLLIDWWPLGRLHPTMKPEARTTCLREKAILLVPALAAGIVTLRAQRGLGAVFTLGEIPFADRLVTALSATAGYLVDMVWPAGLAVFYPLPARITPLALVWSVLLVGTVSLLVVRARGRQPYLLAGWAWFLIGLAPVSGLLQTGSQFRADRYTYLPLVGIFVALVWWLTNRRTPLPVRRGALLLCLPVLLTLAVLSRRQVAIWRDDISLFGHAATVTRDNWMAHNNLGTALLRNGRITEAEAEYRRSLAAAPDYSVAHFNLGNLLAERGETGEAREHYLAAERGAPGELRYREARESLSTGRPQGR